MCGIYGVFSSEASGIDYTECSIISDLMTAGTVRGYDGTGIYYLESKEKDPTMWIQKDAITGGDMATALGKQVRGARLVVGHNRAATIGGVSADTTHPFVFENITGVHNGTFKAWRAMWPDSTQSVDSAALFEALDNLPPDDESIISQLEQLGTGAYALIWYDERTKELHIARNDQRPLYVLQSITGLWFASEKRMLEWVLDRNGDGLIRGFELGINTLLSINSDTGVARHTQYAHDYSYKFTTPKATSTAAGGSLVDRWDSAYDRWWDNDVVDGNTTLADAWDEAYRKVGDVY